MEVGRWFGGPDGIYMEVAGLGGQTQFIWSDLEGRMEFIWRWFGEPDGIYMEVV